MLLQQIEAAPQAGQHAEPEHIDLENAELVEIVLVPFDDGAILHRGILDRHHFVEPAAGDDEAADMLGQMARKAHQLLGEREHLRDARVGRIEAGAARLLLARRLPSTSPRACAASAPTVSSESPKTLPTSRMALRPR